MYNSNTKDLFIKEALNSESRKIRARNLFDKIAIFENLFEKDVACFSKEEYKILFYHLSTGNINTGKYVSGMMRSYVCWYWDLKGVDKNVVLQVLSNAGSISVNYNEKLSSKMIGSPESFAEILDIVYPDINDLTAYNIHRAALWLLYIGVPKELLGDVLKKDVNIKQKVLKVGGISYKIFDEALPVFESLKENNEFFVRRNNKDCMIPSKHPDVLLGSIQEKEPTYPASLCNMLSVFRKKYEEEADMTIDYSVTNIRNSGYYYRMYLDELNNSLDFEKYYKLVYGKSDIVGDAQGKLRKFISNYKGWKKIFNL